MIPVLTTWIMTFSCPRRPIGTNIAWSMLATSLGEAYSNLISTGLFGFATALASMSLTIRSISWKSFP